MLFFSACGGGGASPPPRQRRGRDNERMTGSTDTNFLRRGAHPAAHSRNTPRGYARRCRNPEGRGGGTSPLGDKICRSRGIAAATGARHASAAMEGTMASGPHKAAAHHTARNGASEGKIRAQPSPKMSHAPEGARCEEKSEGLDDIRRNVESHSCRL